MDNLLFYIQNCESMRKALTNWPKGRVIMFYQRGAGYHWRMIGNRSIKQMGWVANDN